MAESYKIPPPPNPGEVQGIDDDIADTVESEVKPTASNGKHKPKPKPKPRTKETEGVAKWSERVRQKYNQLYDVVQENIPGVWPSLEFALSIKSILNIEDCT